MSELALVIFDETLNLEYYNENASKFFELDLNDFDEFNDLLELDDFDDFDHFNDFDHFDNFDDFDDFGDFNVFDDFLKQTNKCIDLSP